MLRIAQAGAVAVVLGLLALLVWDLVRVEGGGVVRDVGAGKVVPAPDWTRPRVDTDGELSLASLRGKVVVLNFWQSYCPPCTHEAPVLAKAAKDWEQKGVVFVGVDVQDLRGPARAFLKRFDITYPNIADGGNLVGRYGVVGYPETFFLTRQACVVPPHIVGPVTEKTLGDGIRNALKRSGTDCRAET
jgi:cytochrome c biogenesis protein CcmG/thiol:disulfide interchange protein DsbE